jgi:crotonobetainyl-CoA:carnitine CoA-transferase CaiB-like acyl-CoA transferase
VRALPQGGRGSPGAARVKEIQTAGAQTMKALYRCEDGHIILAPVEEEKLSQTEKDYIAFGSWALIQVPKFAESNPHGHFVFNHSEFRGIPDAIS